MTDNNLVACDGSMSSNKDILDYTYKHETLNCTSYIDHFLISSTLLNNVKDYDICEVATNMSDHNFIIIFIDLGSKQSNVTSKINGSKLCNNMSLTHTQLRWDHGNLAGYMNATFKLIQPLYYGLVTLHEDIVKPKQYESYRENSKVIFTRRLELFYNSLICCLDSAAEHNIPKKRTNFYKYWWNEEAEI